MKYNIEILTINAITDFYRNVMDKYKHTYSFDDYFKDVDDALNKIYLIETKTKYVLSNRHVDNCLTKTFKTWKNNGYRIASSKKWHYAYTINGDMITIHDACHQQNNESKSANYNKLLYEKIMWDIAKIVKKEINSI